MYSISKVIRELREKYGLSQVEFAEVFGVSDGSAVSRWEKGRRVPDEIVQRLFRYLDDLPEREARDVIRRFRSYGRK